MMPKVALQVRRAISVQAGRKTLLAID